MKKKYFIYLSVLLITGFCPVLAQNSDLKTFPEGMTPAEVGSRIVNKFILTPHTRFGNPRSEKPPTYITYPDACTWLGALWFAKTVKNESMLIKLKERFEPLFTVQKSFQPRMNHVDYNVFGAVPLEIYIQNKDEQKYYELGMQYANTQWELPDGATPEQKAYADKGYSWQTRIWIDDMFMITTIQAQAYRATGDRKYIDRAATEMVMYLKEIQQSNGLFYHAPSAPFFWSRGNGWMAAGMAELLSVLPEDHPDRPLIMNAYQKMMFTLKGYQGSDGMWKQLIDEPQAWNETSGTAMFTYAMITGVKRGWLNVKDYGSVVRNAWLALVTYINEEDEVTDVCEGTNAKNDKDHYMNRKRITGDLHAHAPLLWCATGLLSE